MGRLFGVDAVVSQRPPLWLRSTAKALRMIPPVRGRGRLAAFAHKMLAHRKWREKVSTLGFSIEVSLDDLIGRTIYLDGIFDRQSTEAVCRLITAGETVFDVGGNIGFYTLLFAKLVGDHGMVHVFEPVPSTAKLLKTNLGMNPWSSNRVRLHELALSDAEGAVTMNFSGPSNTGASHVVVAGVVVGTGRAKSGVVQTSTVPCRAGDSIWKTAGRPNISLIKIDIEGHELQALRGMQEMLATMPSTTLLVEVRDAFLRAGGGSREELFNYLQEFGYRAFTYDSIGKHFKRDDTPRDAELVIFSKRQLQNLYSSEKKE